MLERQRGGGAPFCTACAPLPPSLTPSCIFFFFYLVVIGARARSNTRTHYKRRAPTSPGIPIKWTNTGFIKPGSVAIPAPIPPAIIHHTALAHDLAGKAKITCKRMMGEEGELQLMRLHTSTREYLLAPAEHETLLVVQAAHSAALEPLVKAADDAQFTALAASKGGGEKAGKK